jgi:hypothetical protein
VDALELLASDHRAAQTLFDQYEATTNLDERRNLVDEITGHLTRHTVVENHMFYPLLARVISVPDVSVPSPRHDVNDGIHQALTMLPQTASHDRRGTANLMAALHRDFTFHRKFDEKHLHPPLRRALDQPARDELGRLLLEAKDIIPGVIDPVGVETPPTNLAIVIGTFCDRLRDRLGDQSPV